MCNCKSSASPNSVSSTDLNSTDSGSQREIAAARPKTLEELSGLYGIGPAKVERYGPGLLDVVAREASDPPS